MPFETRPFDLGNTLARAAQINSLNTRNELAKLNLDQTRGINNALAIGNTNNLRQFGAKGVALEAQLAQLEGRELETVIKRGRLANDAINSALNSVDMRQSVSSALKNPVLAKIFPNVNIEGMSDEELRASLESAAAETDLFNDPQALSRVVAGQAVTDQGFAPGTVLEETVSRGQVTNTSVLQRPPSKGLSLEVGPDGTVRFSQGNVDAVEVNRKKINTDAVESANSSAALRRDLVSTLPRILANKESVGIRGNLGLGAGGLVTLGFGADAGDEIARLIAGNDQEAIAQIQTRLTTLRSKLRPIVTGEGGTRQSETERQIASKAIGFIDQIKGPADFTRAFPQIVGAMKELISATLENEFEQAAITEAVEFPFDLNSEEGIRALTQLLNDAGFEESDLETAKGIRDRLLRIQNQ